MTDMKELNLDEAEKVSGGGGMLDKILDDLEKLRKIEKEKQEKQEKANPLGK